MRAWRAKRRQSHAWEAKQPRGQEVAWGEHNVAAQHMPFPTQNYVP
jgi:hypothetical protein